MYTTISIPKPLLFNINLLSIFINPTTTILVGYYNFSSKTRKNTRKENIKIKNWLRSEWMP